MGLVEISRVTWQVWKSISSIDKLYSLILVELNLFSETWEFMLAFSTISEHWNGTSYSDHSVWETMTCLSCIFNTMTGDWNIYFYGFNSLATGRSWCEFKSVIFNLALLIGIFKSYYDNVLRWMPQNVTDGKSALAQVMAWCRQATSHYLSQCWPRSTSPYGVTRPQWVNSFTSGDAI